MSSSNTQLFNNSDNYYGGYPATMTPNANNANNKCEYTDSPHDELISTLSSTSINSLFDPDSLFHSTSTHPGTSTITPALTRNNLLKTRQKQTITQEFINTIEQKLQKLNSEHTINHLHNPKSTTERVKVVVLLVGLPASGKSTLCHHIKDYIHSTTGYKCGVYNAGDVRRKRSITFNDANYFDPNNVCAQRDRDLYATITLNHLLSDLDHVDIGFLDATNTTVERRQKMLRHINSKNLAAVILEVESIFADFNIVSGKLNNADYIHQDNKLAAFQDFKNRLSHYKSVYEPVTWEELDESQVTAYMKCVNGGETFELVKNNEVEEKEMEAKKSGANEAEFWYLKVLQNFIDEYDQLIGIEYRKKAKEFYSKEYV